ncbi:hypothetical protein AKJ51_02070 [candidate division MSBL1 archaeon SCGC-AAA382A20]|uniref:DUF763 domain-containing protein n=2 Tax=candidate division MSBL1 TaxID=215777 RepID=A0A133VKW3_9EURY|nr:hypothetical protein AKJ50_01680 [candidate division MSBL1 archaeon SCGC-AAA382A13]KXB07084.1 hypothetical protein AKJ51_02070 [candidate division MSBL1 archaeon SCGC-AAA382A20]
MKKSGVSKLPLHGGKAPSWLVGRMKKLAKPIVRIIVNDYGRDEFLRRLADPYWFQSLGCVLGFDWHSSGVSTVTTGVLKDVLSSIDVGIFAAGGKGKASLKAIDEIEEFSDKFNLSSKETNSFKRSSRMTAKVDNVAVQANAPLYHHAFFGSEDGEWSVVQQGMDTDKGMARRYHWISQGFDSFVKEPHEGIVAEKKKKSVLDLTAEESEECRKVSTDLVKDGPEKVRREFESLRPEEQKSLFDWVPKKRKKQRPVKFLELPKRLNWAALEEAYELQPKNFENLVKIEGVGPATARGLALVSEVIYGESASWRDPARFSYAFGGKDGVPYPVDRSAMDKAHKTLKSALEEAEIGKSEKLKAVKRLEKFSKV